MLQRLRELLREAPLLSFILVIWFLTAVIAIAGRGHGYRNYSTKHGMLPGASVVMRGIHDHVAPWTDVSGGTAGEGQDAADEDEDETPDPAAADSPDPAKAEAGEQDGAEARQDAAGRDEAGKESGTAAQNDAAAENDQAARNDAAAEKEASGQEDADKKADGGQQADAGEEKTPPMQIPETSCSKVVPARDYGAADDQYLSPDDTVYNDDKEGLFAPNGVYYSLQPVDDSYFSDALFIGDSRTVGLLEYGGMEESTSFLARESTSVYDLLDNSKMDYTPLGKKKTEKRMKDLLKKNTFKKIYLSVGINELGIPDTKDYYEAYRKVIKTINELQPGAVIYIQGIMHVSEEKSRKDHVFNNTAIVQRNQAIATLANGRNIFYIDMNGEVCDEDGNLKKDLTGDGIHLKASACDLWHKFLKEHAVVVPD